MRELLSDWKDCGSFYLLMVSYPVELLECLNLSVYSQRLMYEADHESLYGKPKVNTTFIQFAS